MAIHQIEEQLPRPFMIISLDGHLVEFLELYAEDILDQGHMGDEKEEIHVAAVVTKTTECDQGYLHHCE